MLVIYQPRGKSIPKHLVFGCGGEITDNCVNVDLSFSELQIHRAQQDMCNCWLVEHDFSSPSELPVNYFTMIEAKMVMEHIHIDMVPSVLYTMSTLLQVDGKLRIIVPNFDSLITIAQELPSKDEEWKDKDFRKFREINFQLLDPIFNSAGGRGHQSIWNRAMARIWLQSEGFDIESMSTFGQYGMFLDIRAKKLTSFSQPVSL